MLLSRCKIRREMGVVCGWHRSLERGCASGGAERRGQWPDGPAVFKPRGAATQLVVSICEMTRAPGAGDDYGVAFDGMEQIDTITITCSECDSEFTLEAEERKTFRARGFQDPKRCTQCRHERRGRRRRRVRRGGRSGSGVDGVDTTPQAATGEAVAQPSEPDDAVPASPEEVTSAPLKALPEAPASDPPSPPAAEAVSAGEPEQSRQSERPDTRSRQRDSRSERHNDGGEARRSAPSQAQPRRGGGGRRGRRGASGAESVLDRRSPSNERVTWSAVCFRCGQTTELPFKPRGSRPVYCPDCLRLVSH